MKILKTISSALAVIFLTTILISPTLAQTESAVLETTPTVDPEIKEKVEQRIQEVLDAQTNQKRAYVGKITNINSVIEIETRQGIKQIQINEEETIIIGSKREVFKLTDLEIGSYIIAMGYLEGNDLLDTHRIVVTEKPKPFTQVVVYGNITDKSSDGENILTVKALKDEKVYEIEVTSKTKINQKIEEEIKNTKFTDLKVGDRLVAIGTPEENNFLTVRLIRVLSFQETGSSKKTKEESPVSSPASELEE